MAIRRRPWRFAAGTIMRPVPGKNLCLFRAGRFAATVYVLNERGVKKTRRNY